LARFIHVYLAIVSSVLSQVPHPHCRYFFKRPFLLHGTKIAFTGCYGLAAAATKAPRGRPSPRRGAEENGKKQAENWWVGIRAV